MKLKKTILTIGIAIIFILFIAYAIETIYSSPKFNDYCPTQERQIANQTACEQADGIWSNYPEGKPIDPTQLVITGYCDTYTKCNEEYQQAIQPYNRNVFFISVILGLITIIIAALLQLESVSAGLLGGGVILIIYGTIRYWGEMSDIIRTIMLGIVLAILIWLGYKKIEPNLK